MTKAATPTPMPAFAPVLRPSEVELELSCVGVEVGTEEVVVRLLEIVPTSLEVALVMDCVDTARSA